MRRSGAVSREYPDYVADRSKVFCLITEPADVPEDEDRLMAWAGKAIAAAVRRRATQEYSEP